MFFCGPLAFCLTQPSLAQELEPRRWSHLPVGVNFLGGAYAYTEADISFNPVLLIEDARMKLHTAAVKYIRTFEVFDKSARIDLLQAYQEGEWSGLLDGVPTSVDREGPADSVVRFAVNVLGAPPLKGKEFAAYRAELSSETIVGIGMAAQLPTGDYHDDKLINLGENRFTLRPQLGVVHNRGKWGVECTGGSYIYTKNDEFWKGNTLEQDPLFTIQGHLTYTFRPGLWIGAGVGYGYGGESKVNGVRKDDRKENVGCLFSAGYPITKKLGAKIAYIATRSQTSIGADTDTVSAALSFLW